MTDFIFDMNNVLFTTALILTVGAFSLEAIGVLAAGFDLFGLIDSIIPDIETAEPDLDDAPIFHQLLGWAKHKNCPAAIWGVLLTGSFGTFGLILQAYMVKAFGHSLDAWFAVPACLIPSFIVTSVISKGLGNKVFVDNTTAVTKESLVGCQGYVTIGKASTERAAEVSVKDKFGKTHLIMCRAEEGELNQNDLVVLTKVTGGSAVAKLATN